MTNRSWIWLLDAHGECAKKLRCCEDNDLEVIIVCKILLHLSLQNCDQNVAATFITQICLWKYPFLWVCEKMWGRKKSFLDILKLNQFTSRTTQDKIKLRVYFCAPHSNSSYSPKSTTRSSTAHGVHPLPDSSLKPPNGAVIHQNRFNAPWMNLWYIFTKKKKSKSRGWVFVEATKMEVEVEARVPSPT